MDRPSSEISLPITSLFSPARHLANRRSSLGSRRFNGTGRYLIFVTK